MYSALFSLALLAAPASQEASAVNTRCPVTGMDVRNHLICKWTLVHGRRYYVADRAAATRLRNNPNAYLRADGSPRVERPEGTVCR